MKAWQRKGSLGGPRIKTSMEDHEVQILHALVSNIVDLLEQRRDAAPADSLAELTGIRSGNSEPPGSAPLRRLLPDFHRTETGEDEASTRTQNSGMRILHEPDIIDSKLAAAAVVLRSLPARGGTVSLTLENAHLWAACLNDVRLGLGAVLMESAGESSDKTPGEHYSLAEIPESVPDSDPRSAHLDVYHWLTFMQDSLCEALVGR